MSRLNQLKIGLAVIGLLVWGYGYRADDPSMRWTGIAFLFVAALLRFMKRPSGDESAT